MASQIRKMLLCPYYKNIKDIKNQLPKDGYPYLCHICKSPATIVIVDPKYSCCDLSNIPFTCICNKHMFN